MITLREPDTGAAFTAASLAQLAEQLGKSRAIDADGAEFAVFTLNLRDAISIIEQLAAAMED